jgi:pimeloyl-ACP methyl ester carboxylesterase
MNQSAISVQYRSASIDGLNVFYREGGNPLSPTLLLLHGFPTSSHMFRELIPLFADRFHVIAPDYIGFGQSDAPDHSSFTYSFDNRPGLDLAQLDLLENYKTNVAAYETWHAAFREYQPKTLIVWGKNDPFFVRAGAEAYLCDLPDAKLVWLDAGHFVLDENAGQVAAEIKEVFDVA